MYNVSAFSSLFFHGNTLDHELFSFSTSCNIFLAAIVFRLSLWVIRSTIFLLSYRNELPINLLPLSNPLGFPRPPFRAAFSAVGSRPNVNPTQQVPVRAACTWHPPRSRFFLMLVYIGYVRRDHLWKNPRRWEI